MINDWTAGISKIDQCNAWYEVGGLRTFSKAKAIMWANGDLSKIHFNYMDEVWDQIDWTVRPLFSAAELIDQRVKQVRSEYQHVRLAYSGGYDSHTIMDSFIRTGTRLDSVMLRVKKYYTTAENNTSVTQIQRIRNTVMPNLKVDVVTLEPDRILDFYRDNKEDWITASSWYEPHLSKVGLNWLINNYSEYQKVGENQMQQKSCTLYGFEKPRLWIENGAWYSTMIDRIIEPHMGTLIEPFFTTAKLPELQKAQVYGVMDWLESLPFDDIEQLDTFLHKVQSHSDDWDAYRDWNISTGRTPVLNSYSYKGGSTKQFFSKDPRNHPDSQVLESYAAKTAAASLLQWNGQNAEFKKQYPTAFDSNGQTKGIWSKKYYIKPVELNKKTLILA